MESTPLQKPIHQLYWDIFKEFSHERSIIDETRFQDYLKRFEELIACRIMVKSILDGGEIFNTPTVIAFVTTLLTDINITLLLDTKGIKYSDSKKKWFLSFEVDFNFDDSPRIRERKPDEMNVEEDCELDEKGRRNVIVHLADRSKKVKIQKSDFLKEARCK